MFYLNPCCATFCTKVTSTYFHKIRYLHNWSSKSTRKEFLDYFTKENDHKFIRSSPVVPFCDPTVAFVNAGMNQFKGIFLGQQEPTSVRAANSQKCVRVGGKHNDLSTVGQDGYHHTFFEMLGNWSFGDYFKREACELAWNLLTGPYNLPPSSLYVSYFGGDPKLKLEPDLECKDIWRSIGVSEDHLVPFGSKDNFWEMGSTGPCGPCTEIHIDHTRSRQNRRQDVNQDLADLTELWNIVFIQYDRNENAEIKLLPKKHIDTGMGLERLTAILQGKKDNYDTDIFTSLFTCIKKNCKGLPDYNGQFGKQDINNIDTVYRILADHSRTITVCLADGMIPEQNQKLRKILRKSLHLAESVFKKEKGLLNELSYAVAENLGHTYPEIHKNIKQVQEIISYEEEIYKSLRKSATKDWSSILSREPRLKNLNAIEMPGLIAAYQDLMSSEASCVSPQLAFRMYDTHGLDGDTISQLARALHLPFQPELLKKELEDARSRTKEKYMLDQSLTAIARKFPPKDIPKTNDSAKYNYNKLENTYKYEDLNVRILQIINKKNEIVDKIAINEECYIVLDRTNLYTESGGQSSDSGKIKLNSNVEFTITDVLNVNGYIFHNGKLTSGMELNTNDFGMLSVADRVSTMANHTATHLLNAAVKKVLNSTTCQKSSSVTATGLSFDLGLYGKKLTAEDIEQIEKAIRNTIENRVTVEAKIINSQKLLSLNNVTMIPGEVYPENEIRLIKIEDTNSGLISCEPCCGTHVLNTADIQDICITSYRSLGRSTISLTAVTREKAVLAHKNGQRMLKKVLKYQKNNEINDIDESVAEIKHKLIHGTGDEDMMPVFIKMKCLNILNEASKKIRGTEREHLKDLINLEMKTVLETNQIKSNNNMPFIVHFLECSCILDNVSLNHATKTCAEIPVVVLSYSENMVKARCCVPRNLITEKFNAELWMKHTVAEIFKGSFSPPRGQDGTLVTNMKAKKVNAFQWEALLAKAMACAKQYAKDNL